MLSATCYLLPLITVRWLVLVGVSTSLTRLSLVLSHTAQRSLNPGEKNEASFTTHLSSSAATAVGLGCLRRTDRRSALRIKISPGEIHHQHGLCKVKCRDVHSFVSWLLQQIAIMFSQTTLWKIQDGWSLLLIFYIQYGKIWTSEIANFNKLQSGWHLCCIYLPLSLCGAILKQTSSLTPCHLADLAGCYCSQLQGLSSSCNHLWQSASVLSPSVPQLVSHQPWGG